MNSLPFAAAAFPPPTRPSRRRRIRAIFRFPREMHIPLRAIAIRFDVIPQARWLRRSFRAWFSAAPAPEPAWMRDVA